MTSSCIIDNFKQQAGLLPVCCFLLLLLTPDLFAQAPVGDNQEPAPAAARDTLFSERKVEADDSLAVPIPSFGQLASNQDEIADEVTKWDRRAVQYRSTSELLARGSHFLPLSHGGNAQHNSLSIAGGLNADIATSFNGRTLVDPWSNAFHLAQIAPEEAERMEILTGTDAVGLAGAMTLSAINVQEMIHNSATPYTALWYSQGAGDIVSMDASYSQNVARGLNVSFGVRRSGSADPRYTNTGFDVWNVRAGFRYTVSETTHLGISYQLSSLNTGLWGGLRTIHSLDDLTERTAPPVFFTLQDESRRHDITLTAFHMFDRDTSFTINAQVYGSYNNMLRIRDSSMFVSQIDTVENLLFEGRHAGILVRGENRFAGIQLRTGVGVDFLSSAETVYTEAVSSANPQVFAHVRIPLGGVIRVTGAARATVVNGKALSAFGAGIVSGFGPGSWLKLDLSTSQRAPSAAEGFSLSSESHLLATLTGNYSTKELSINGQAFYRRVSDRLVTQTDRFEDQSIRTTTTSNQGVADIIGFSAQAIYSSKWIELRPILRTHWSVYEGQSDNRFPIFSGELYAAFVYRVGKNSVRLGARGAVLSSMTSQQYVPTTWTYTEPIEKQAFVSNGLDVFLVALLGNASIRVSYENLLANRWYTTAIAPEVIRDLRLSVTWSFFD